MCHKSESSSFHRFAPVTETDIAFMTADVLRFVGPSPIRSGTGTNTASVGCTEGGGGRLVGVDNPSFCCCSSCRNEVVSRGDLLLFGGNTALVAKILTLAKNEKCTPDCTF